MARSLLLFGATLIDGTGAPPVEDGALLVEGGRIARVGRSGEFPRPPDAEEIDLTRLFLLPGFVDAHAHFLVTGRRLRDLALAPYSLPFFHAARHLHETLMAGVTSARDASGADLGVKRAVEDRLVYGPRLSIAIAALSRTGGFADGWLPSGHRLPAFLPHPGRPSGLCDGPEEFRRMAREVLRAGADVLKIWATGVPRDAGEEARTEISAAELAAAAEEAKRAGVPLMVHASGSEGATLAANAGAASVERGVRLDAAACDALARKGVFLVPSLLSSALAAEAASDPRAAPLAGADRARRLLDEHVASVGRALKAGVKIAMGSDAGTVPHGENLRELAWLAKAGLSPLHALSAGTRHGAEVLGMEKETGTLQPGKRADLVAVRRNPLEDLESLARRDNLALVMKDGEIVHRTV
jgi:imidazolonepropionase-like amidohydrolase